MKKFLFLLILTALLIPVFSSESDLEARVDSILLPLVKDNLISGTVLIAKGDSILFSKGYGLADREWDIANTVDTVYRLGSVTKQFTAMGILRLVQEKKIGLDDPLSKYIRNFPAGDKITIRSLLNHTSGVTSYNYVKDYDQKLIQAMSIDQVIDWFKNEPRSGEVGEKFSYSNSGYVLLAAVIEKVSGKSYAEFLTEQIFAPLEMKATGQDIFEQIIPRRASGYANYFGEIINAPYRDLPFTSGAGSLRSTAGDLFRWARALLTNKLLGPELTEKMFTPGKGNYGYGWFIRERFGRKLIEHAGAINGFGTQLQLFPANDTVVIGLYNFESAYQRRVDEALGAIALGLPTEQFYFPGGRALTDAEFAIFPGTYAADESTRLTIFRKGQGLALKLADGREFRCLPQGPGVLLVKELHMILQPAPGKEGPPEALIVTTGLHRFGAKREADQDTKK